MCLKSLPRAIIKGAKPQYVFIQNLNRIVSFIIHTFASFLSLQNEITSSKLLFPEHLPLSKIQAGIKSNTFLQGTFRASRDNYLEATVFVHGEGDESKEASAAEAVVSELTQNVITTLLESSGNVIELRKHSSNIRRTFCVTPHSSFERIRMLMEKHEFSFIDKIVNRMHF